MRSQSDGVGSHGDPGDQPQGGIFAEGPRLIGFTPGGRPVISVMGGDGTEGGDGGDGGDGDGGDKGKPQGGDKDKPQGGNDDDKGGSQGDELTPEQIKALQRKVSDLEGDNKKYRDREKEREEAELSEKEKAEKRITDLEGDKTRLERENRQLRTRMAVTSAAREAGAIYPDRMWRELDEHEIDYDDSTGEPTNVEDLIKSLKQRVPKLFGEEGSTRPAGNGDGGTRRPSGDIPDDVVGVGRLRHVERKGAKD